MPVFPQSRVLAPLDIMDSLLAPWSTDGEIEVKNAFVYDTISQYIPYDFSVYKSLNEDGYVGWNPNTHSGTSIRENAMLCPGDFRHQLYRIMPFWDAWDWGRMLHFAIAGIGMILLLNLVGVSPLFTVLGAVSFTFYSQFIVWIYTAVMMAGFCWAPWILWSLLYAKSRVIDKEKKGWQDWALAVALPSVFIGFGLRNGFLHTTLFTITLVLLFYVSELVGCLRTTDRACGKRFLFLYGAMLLGGLLVASGVLMDIVPPAATCDRQLASRSWLEALSTLPTLATSFLPTIMGTPQTLDVTKAFNSALFNIKFGGCVVLILAILALLKKESPLLPKILFCVSLIIPFTPLDKWFYSRSTVIFALGAAWLATWYLSDAKDHAPSRAWKHVWRIVGSVVVLWFVGSIVLALFEDRAFSVLERVVVDRLPSNKLGRVDWMIARIHAFIQGSKIWAPYNLLTLCVIGLGIWGCSKINIQTKRFFPYACLITLCTFAEVGLFASTWIKISDRPKETDSPYNAQPWIKELKSHLDGGTVYFYDRSNFDYMQLNTPSAYDIRQCEGYESITPKRLMPIGLSSYDPVDFARAGVSHVLVPPNTYPDVLSEWEKVMDTSELVLYENPQFTSLYQATLVTGETIPVYPSSRTANMRAFNLPKGTRSLYVAESYHRNWRYSFDEKTWQKPALASGPYYALEVKLQAPLTENKEMTLRFKP